MNDPTHFLARCSPMIVKMQRPVDDDGEAPWMVRDDRDGILGFIDPTPELRRMMEEPSGWFEVERLENGWDVKGRVTPT